MKFFLCLIFAVVSLSSASLQLPENKKAKSFSIFSVVQFANSQCEAKSSTAANPMQGTCFTTSECTSNGGTASGSCASGFGVCCVLITSTCGSTVSKNVTYIQNPGFPSGFTTAGTCSYTLSSTSDICQIRLDLDNFVIGNPDNGAVTAANQGLCPASDRLVITSSSGSGPNASPPILCGTLSGQHMYVETGRVAPTGATITISNTGGAGLVPARTWKIKVTQIECGSISLAPTDCLQYYVGPAGSFSSLNYQAGNGGQLIKNMFYNICFRQEEGFCSIQYTANDVATVPAFKLGADTSSKRSLADCGAAFILIPSINGDAISDTYCGTFFNSKESQKINSAVTSTTTPFTVGVVSVGADGLASQLGFNLMYSQLPC